MNIAHYFVQGEVSHTGLPQWLVEHTGLYGHPAEADKIVIWINSNGGDVLAALEAINLMRASEVPIITIINGAAESAALLIAVAGHRRLAFSNSWGMAHNFSTSAEGNYHDLADMAKHNELLQEAMADVLERGSSLSNKEVKERFLGRGTKWYSADELLELKLIDRIVHGALNLKNCLGI